MESVIYKNEACELCEDFMDVGYMAESFEAYDIEDKLLEVKRSTPNKALSILISFPNASIEFEEEILKVDKLLSAIEVEVYCYLIFDRKDKNINSLNNKLQKLTLLFDKEEEFGNMYGTKIISGSLKNNLTKSLFIISKDGSVFYVDMPKNLNKILDLDRLRIELNKAYTTYRGKGCH